jgi:hypothetical protein
VVRTELPGDRISRPQRIIPGIIVPPTAIIAPPHRECVAAALPEGPFVLQ